MHAASRGGPPCPLGEPLQMHQHLDVMYLFNDCAGISIYIYIYDTCSRKLENGKFGHFAVRLPSLCQQSAREGRFSCCRQRGGFPCTDGSRGASLADAAGQHRHLTGVRRGGGRSECGWIGAHPECAPCRLWPALRCLLHPCNARTVLATPIGAGVCNGRPIVCVAYGLSSCRLHRAEHTHARNSTRILAGGSTYRLLSCPLWQASAASSV